MKKRVHPNAAAVESPKPTISTTGDRHSPPPPPPTALIVWRKSMILNCNGFTVLDAKGNLMFFVDKYEKSDSQREIVLMDAAGNSLLTIRRKELSFGKHWKIYDGEEAVNPIFSMRKKVNIFHWKSLAQVSPCAAPAPASGCGSTSADAAGGAGEVYEVEGSYAQRCCTVYDERHRAMAEIQRKEAVGGMAFGLDVFRLVVQPGFDAAIAMAIVILLEEMFGSINKTIKNYRHIKLIEIGRNCFGIPYFI